MRFAAGLLALLPFLGACAGTIEARALDGTPLERIAPSGERLEHYRAELTAARERWRSTASEDDAVWVGRHLGYLGRYREAIDWYGARLEDFPRSAKLLRHRGHRLLSVREFERAAADLERAWGLVAGLPDEVEPDGAPNALGIPRSTLKTNVLYHLALARWLQGDFARAEAVWRECNALSPNDDAVVSALNWHVHALRRLGREREARAALAPVLPEMDVVENHAYHRILLLQKGLLEAGDVLDASGEDGVQDATAAYGVSLWHLANGERAAAEELWRRMVKETPWNAFGHIGAEAELARSR